MKSRLLLAGILAAAGLSAAPVAYAVTPTFSLYGASGSDIQINVSGDANSSAVLFYNVGSAAGAQVAILGMTDSSGQISKSVAGTGLNTGTSAYVMVNSQQSAIAPWSTTAASTPSPTPTPTPSATTSSGALTFDTTNPVVAVGSTVSINITSAGTGFYVSASSNLGITSTIVNDKAITISGLANGTNAVTICSVANVCGIINVTVGAAGTTTSSTSNAVISFNNTNPAITVGQLFNVTLSGAASYFVSSNSNATAVQATISGNTLTLSGLAAGSASLVVCAPTGGCGTLNVTVTTTATTTPAPSPLPIVPATVGNSASIQATIATMQTQLGQMLLVIQTMQSQLNQILAGMSIAPSASASASASTPAFSGAFTSFLSLNSTGSEVSALQKKLTSEGFYSGPITGTFGPLTEAALKKYQTAHGIDPAGYVGPSTRAALNAQ